MLRSLRLCSLEARLTPAGAYTSSVVGGVLTLTGTDDVENITILDTGTGVQVTGNAGTLVDNVNVVFFGVNINGLKIIAKGGDDVVSLDGTNPISWSGALDVDLGDSSGFGGNQFNLNAGNTIAVDRVKLKGGEGFDSVNFFGTTATVAKDFVADFGSGGSLLSIQAGTTINGGLAVKALNGFDQLTLTGTAVTKNVSFSPGDGGSDVQIGPGSVIDGDVGVVAGFGGNSVNLDGATIKGKKGLTVVSGTGNMTVETNNNPSSFTQGGITAASKDGFAGFFLNPGGNLTLPGAISVKGATVNSSINANLSAGSLTLAGVRTVNSTVGVGTTTVNITKGVKITAKIGDATLDVSAGTVTIGGALTVAGNLDTDVSLQSAGGTAVTGNVSITSKLAEANLVQNTGPLAVTGNFLMAGAITASANMAPVGASNITGTTTFTSKTAFAGLVHSGADNMTFGKAVTVTGKTNAFVQVNSSGITNINGALKATSSPVFGAVTLFVTGSTFNCTEGITATGSIVFGLLVPTTTGSVTKNVVFTAGLNGLFANANPNLAFGANLTLTSGNQDSTVNLTGSTIAGNLTITTGGGVDNVNLQGISVGGLTNIKTNGGGDIINLDNEAVFTGATLIDTGTGDDNLSLGQNLGLSANAVTFTGKATIKTGAGNDFMLLGRDDLAGGDPFSLVSFGAGSVIDGGLNLNTFDDENGLQIGAPSIVGWTAPTP